MAKVTLVTSLLLRLHDLCLKMRRVPGCRVCYRTSFCNSLPMSCVINDMRLHLDSHH